jgi:DeoR family glycerol-3-phosphate regulon repressor
MAQNLRQAEILRIAQAEGRVLVEDVAARLGVTVQTVRRDLSELAAAGRLRRVHGGAIPPSGVANIAYAQRRRLNAAAKEAIGRRAAAEVPEGASLFLGIGTTCEAVARALSGRQGLMVVTNNLTVAAILAEGGGAEVVVTGGEVRQADAGLVGAMAAEALRGFRPDLAVVGISAVDEAGSLLDYDLREAAVSRAALDGARRRLLVADAAKFARRAPVRVAGISDIDVLVTDAPLPPALARAAALAGTEVILAPSAGQGATVDNGAAGP